ncbi:RKD2 [Acrasis kona]|uniref:RKD2 n=1 Tax=Acrasis kona TaxID=1008807 RepID=A0AAW2ZCH2_9EUKA
MVMQCSTRSFHAQTSSDVNHDEPSVIEHNVKIIQVNMDGIKKKKPKLTRQCLEQNFAYPQEEAANRLGISLSTLKRKFRSLGLGKRWPYQEMRQIERKRSLSFILNPVELTSAKRLDYRVMNALSKAFLDSMPPSQRDPNQQDSSNQQLTNFNTLLASVEEVEEM